MEITSLPLNNLFYFLFLIGVFVLFYTFNQFKDKIFFRAIILARTLIITILLFLLLEPVLLYEKEELKELSWNVYIDRSLSMSYHTHPSKVSYFNGVLDFVKKMRNNNVGFNLYSFSSNVEEWVSGDKEINGSSTNISSIYEHINSNVNNNLVGAVLISDGQANLGTSINKNIDKIKIPIHVIGAGDLDPMIDVQIYSIEAPPVIIKGEEAELDVTILSYGKLKERANVTLYDKKKLIGSKVITLFGNGTKEKVKFLIKPVSTGEKSYVVKVNTLEDEINIKNNKQTVRIQVLKNEYKIAIITGAPNFNTRILKNIFEDNSEYSLDHFIYANNSFRPSLNEFWKETYDLILFDNHPIKEMGNKWVTYRKAFAKKLISHKSNFGIIYGDNIDYKNIKQYLELFDLSSEPDELKKNEIYGWNFTNLWKELFPFHAISSKIDNDYLMLPPLKPGLKIKSEEGKILASFNDSDLFHPIILIGEKNNLRYFIWTTSDLSSLYYKTQGTNFSEVVNETINPIFNWLLRTKGDKEIYFKTNKNSYQQGELIEFIGKPIIEKEFTDEGIVKIIFNDKVINSKPLKYNHLTGMYNANVWASQSGTVNYEIKFGKSQNSHIIGRGSFEVQESQVELNQVFLNENPLKKLANDSGGKYERWDNKNKLLSIILPSSRIEAIKYSYPLHKSVFITFFIIGLLIIEWVLRRRLGLS